MAQHYNRETGELRPIGVQADFTRNGVLVMVEGESLEPVPEVCVPPEMPARLLSSSESAMRAEVRGWGPDYTNVDVYCPDGCPWERTWEDAVSLAVIADAVQRHLEEAHPE